MTQRILASGPTKVWKFSLTPNLLNGNLYYTVQMPTLTRVLSAKWNNHTGCVELWGIFHAKDEQVLVNRKFVIMPTGAEIEYQDLTHIQTIKVPTKGLDYIFHIFEINN